MFTARKITPSNPSLLSSRQAAELADVPLPSLLLDARGAGVTPDESVPYGNGVPSLFWSLDSIEKIVVWRKVRAERAAEAAAKKLIDPAIASVERVAAAKQAQVQQQ